MPAQSPLVMNDGTWVTAGRIPLYVAGVKITEIFQNGAGNAERSRFRRLTKSRSTRRCGTFGPECAADPYPPASSSRRRGSWGRCSLGGMKAS